MYATQHPQVKSCVGLRRGDPNVSINELGLLDLADGQKAAPDVDHCLSLFTNGPVEKVSLIVNLEAVSASIRA